MNRLSRRIAFFVICALLTPAMACNKYANDPDLRLARDFIDAYYVFADQGKALALSSDRAEDSLKKELELVQGIENRERAYATRDVVFELKNSKLTDDEADYFYELKIIQPGLGNFKKMVHIVIDRKNHKVKSFGEME